MWNLPSEESLEKPGSWLFNKFQSTSLQLAEPPKFSPRILASARASSICCLFPHVRRAVAISFPLLSVMVHETHFLHDKSALSNQIQANNNTILFITRGDSLILANRATYFCMLAPGYLTLPFFRRSRDRYLQLHRLI